MPSPAVPLRVFDPNFLITRIGETAIQLGVFAMMRELGWLEPMRVVVLAPSEHVANPYLLDYFRPWVDLAASYPAEPYSTYSGTEVRLPDGRTVEYDRAKVAVNKVWEEQGRDPLLALRQAHREAGEKLARELGIPEGAWFAALHVRESGYVDGQGYMSDAHNRYRNADIADFMAAARAIVGAGGWVVRLGDPSMISLPPTPGVIDYAHCEKRNPWMDIYLMAAARFLLGTTSGPSAVAPLFGVPVAMADNVPFFERPVSGRDLFICKLYLRDGEPVPFAELMGPDWRTHRAVTAPLLDNSADEIRELAEEMMARLGGTAEYDAEDAALQGRLTKLAETFESHGVASRMGRDFLRRHGHLLA